MTNSGLPFALKSSSSLISDHRPTTNFLSADDCAPPCCNQRHALTTAEDTVDDQQISHPCGLADTISFQKSLPPMNSLSSQTTAYQQQQYSEEIGPNASSQSHTLMKNNQPTGIDLSNLSNEVRIQREQQATVCEVDEVYFNIAPKVGMTFTSVEEAFHFYKAYGYYAGFGVMRRTSHNFGGMRYRSGFACNKEGKPRQRPANPNSKRMPILKIGCKAMILIKDNHLDGRWTIENVVLDHNHPLDPQSVRFFKCFRQLPEYVKKMLEINDAAGVPLHKSINAAFKQAGGCEKCSFTQKDCRNHVEKLRRLKLSEGDAEALMKYFSHMQTQNSNFFYSCSVDEKGRLSNVFWADARSRAAYRYFGDVITFDTTYLTNQYAMPFAPFVGVNHHGQSILLGCGLLANEKIESYNWLFTQWLQCMNGKAPNAIITDQCQSIGGAVEQVFPQTRQRLCLWHIMKKLPEKLRRLEKKNVITLRLSKVVYDTLTVSDFEREWDAMIVEFDLHNNEWFSSLYKDRRRWVPVFVKDTFWAGMSTTQRSESMNAFFDGYVNSKTSLKMFVEQYDNALRSKFEKEAQEDSRCFHYTPKLLTKFLFEEQLAKVYTINIFYKFQEEVKNLMQCTCTVLDRSGPASLYVVADLDDFGNRVDYRVVYTPSDEDIWCICRSFQFRGILCRHALCVLRQEFVQQIPEKYIMKRWRKDFKRLHSLMSFPQLSPMRDMTVYDEVYMVVQHYLADFVEIASIDKVRKEHVFLLLKRTKEELMKYDKSLGDKISISHEQDNHGLVTDHNELANKVLDPIKVSSKGRPRSKRLVGHLEKAQKKFKKRTRHCEQFTGEQSVPNLQLGSLANTD